MTGGYSGRIGTPKGASTAQYNKAVTTILKLGNGAYDRDAVEWALLEPVDKFGPETQKANAVTAITESVMAKLGAPIMAGLRKGKFAEKEGAEALVKRIVNTVPVYFWQSVKAKKMRQDLMYGDEFLDERLEKEDALATAMDGLSYKALAGIASKTDKVGDRMAIMEYLRGQGIVGGRRGRSRSRSRSRSKSRGRGLETMFGDAGLQGGRRRKSRSRSRGRGLVGGSRWTSLVKKHRGDMSAAKKEYYGSSKKRSSSRRGSGMAGGRRKRSSSRSRRFGKLY